MTGIDEIMGAIGRHGDDCIRDADAASESFEVLREMIAVALEEARREGAEAMREAAAAACNGAQPIGGRAWSAEQKSCFVALTHVADYIRALPLPTGERQAVLMTDEQISAEMVKPGNETISEFARAIEAAVLAANNLEVRRG